MASFGHYQDAAMPTPGATPPSSPRRDPAEERLRAMETIITGMQATLGTFADKVNYDMKGLNDGFQVDLAETKAGVGVIVAEAQKEFTQIKQQIQQQQQQQQAQHEDLFRANSNAVSQLTARVEGLELKLLTGVDHGEKRNKGMVNTKDLRPSTFSGKTEK